VSENAMPSAYFYFDRHEFVRLVQACEWDKAIACLSGLTDSESDVRKGREAARTKDMSARTPLMLAALAGQTELCRILAPFSDLAAFGHDREDALSLAMLWNQEECARLLLNVFIDSGAPLNRAFFAAAAGGSSLSQDVFDRLLPCVAGAERNERGATALMLAAQSGKPERVRALLPASDAKMADSVGRTALMFAALSATPECIELLLPFSEANARDVHGTTALGYAVNRLNGLDAVRLLLAACDPKISDKDGRTPYLEAVRLGSAEMLELLAPKSDEKATTHGRDALMVAAREGHAHLIPSLLKTCDPLAMDLAGVDALKWAILYEKTAVVALLSPFSDLRRKDKNGATAFSLAVERGAAECADLLLAGAEMDDIQAAFDTLGRKDGRTLMPRAMALLEGVAIEQAMGAMASKSAAKPSAERAEASAGVDSIDAHAGQEPVRHKRAPRAL